MIEKAIRQKANKALKKWLSSIVDKDVKEIAERNALLCGGAITSMMLNEEPNDYDIYFKTKSAAIKVAEYYAREFMDRREELGQSKVEISVLHSGCYASDGTPVKIGNLVFDGVPSGTDVLEELESSDRVKLFIRSCGVARDEEEESEDGAEEVSPPMDEGEECAKEEESGHEAPKYRPVFFSSNAITLSNGIQLITRFHGSADTIHEYFDFVHTKTSYDYSNSELSIPAKAYECVLNKRLVYNGSRYPICSLFRIRKFIERGWVINAGQILKMSLQISDLNLRDLPTLEDQLVGVDSTYFKMMIRKLEEKESVTHDYVIELIEEIFE